MGLRLQPLRIEVRDERSQHYPPTNELHSSFQSPRDTSPNIIDDRIAESNILHRPFQKFKTQAHQPDTIRSHLAISPTLATSFQKPGIYQLPASQVRVSAWI